jgi:hypothetical protein
MRIGSRKTRMGSGCAVCLVMLNSKGSTVTQDSDRSTRANVRGI